VLSRTRLVAFTVEGSPATIGWAKVTHGGMVKVPRHVAQGCEVANSGEPIKAAVTQAGMVAGIEYWPKFIHGVIFLTPLRYPTAPSTNNNLNGIKPVDLDMVVLWLHTTLINSYDHFPLG
jgi:hypothetical protein